MLVMVFASLPCPSGPAHCERASERLHACAALTVSRAVQAENQPYVEKHF